MGGKQKKPGRRSRGQGGKILTAGCERGFFSSNFFFPSTQNYYARLGDRGAHGAFEKQKQSHVGPAESRTHNVGERHYGGKRKVLFSERPEGVRGVRTVIFGNGET